MGGALRGTLVHPTGEKSNGYTEHTVAIYNTDFSLSRSATCSYSHHHHRSLTSYWSCRPLRSPASTRTSPRDNDIRTSLTLPPPPRGCAKTTTPNSVRTVSERIWASSCGKSSTRYVKASRCNKQCRCACVSPIVQLCCCGAELLLALRIALFSKVSLSFQRW